MQGRSLVPLLKGQTPGRLAEELLLPLLRIPRPTHVRPHYGVVTDRYKLVHFYEPDVDDWELFDLKTDPQELTSVYGKPEYADVQKRAGRRARPAAGRAEGPRPGPGGDDDQGEPEEESEEVTVLSREGVAENSPGRRPGSAFRPEGAARK